MKVTVTTKIEDGLDKSEYEMVVSEDALLHVGFSFNPSNSGEVTEAKALSARLIDMVLAPEFTRLKVEVPGRMAGAESTSAIGHIKTAQMWVVKFLTRFG